MTQADSVLVALHYQNENCHPEGKIRIGLAADAEEDTAPAGDPEPDQ